MGGQRFRWLPIVDGPRYHNAAIGPLLIPGGESSAAGTQGLPTGSFFAAAALRPERDSTKRPPSPYRGLLVFASLSMAGSVRAYAVKGYDPLHQGQAL